MKRPGFKRGRAGGRGEQGDSHDADKKHADPAKPAQVQNPGRSPSPLPPSMKDVELSKSTDDGDQKVNKQEEHPHLSHRHLNPSSKVMVPSTIQGMWGTASLLRREPDIYFCKGSSSSESKDLGSSESSSKRSSSQDSSLKGSKSRKPTIGHLDQFSEKSKDELSKGKLQLQQQQQQQQHQQQQQQQLQPKMTELRLKEFLGRREPDIYFCKGSSSSESKDLGSSESSSEHSSSQDSSLKGTKSRKPTIGHLDQLSERSKDELSKGKLQLQHQQNQQHQQQQQQLQPKTTESRLKEFLGRFVKQGTQGLFYEKKVKFMRDLDIFQLEVDFNDIMQHDFQLAVDIVNHKSPEKLQAAAREFIKMHVSDEEKKAAIWRASIAFVLMPDSIIPVTELLQFPDKLVDDYINSFGPEHSGCNLSVLSAAILGGFLEHFLDTHVHFGRAWNGDYGLNDLYVINKSQFVLKKKPSFVLEGDGTAQFILKKADLNRLIKLFTPCMYRKSKEKKNGEPSKASEFPLFYQKFCDDLQNVSLEDISKPCFKAYILNSPALKMPQARHDLVCSSRLALKRPISKAVHALVTENPCPNHEDWRTSISQSTLDVLRDVYYHYREKDGEEQAASGSGDTANEQAASGSGDTANEPDQFEPFAEPFAGNIKGIITYDRNLKNHSSKKRLFKSIAEVEVFSSTKLVEYLPRFVKGLFFMDSQSLNVDFANILSDYKSARVRTIDGSEVKAVTQLSFWEFEPANFIK